MATSATKFQFDRNESFKGLLLPLILFAGAVVIQIKMAWQIGFTGFHLDLIPAAGFQESLNAILSREAFESLLIRFLQRLTIEGYLGAKLWQIATLACHYTNAVLAYFVARRVLHGEVGVSLAIAALVGMNPLGMEALVWGCCLHIILTLTWIFLGLLVYRYHSHAESTFSTTLRSMGLLFIQIAALVTWDWGLIVFPIIALVALSAPNEASKKMRKRTGIVLLTPAFFVWLIGSLLILSFSDFSEVTLLPISKIAKNFVMAPVEGLLPLLRVELFYSWVGILLSLGVFAVLISLVVFCPSNLSLIGAYLLTYLPWLFFEQPEGSDFYLGLPFLYLCIASLKELKNWGIFALFVYLFFQFIWMYERVQVIEKGEAAARSLNHEISKIPGEAVIVNYPEYFGSSKLLIPSKLVGMREGTHIHAKTSDCPNVRRGCSLAREEICHEFSQDSLFEIVLNPEDETAFSIIPMEKAER